MIVHLYRDLNIRRQDQTWDNMDEKGRAYGGDTTLHYYRHQGIPLHRGVHPDPAKRRGIRRLLDGDGKPPPHIRFYWYEEPLRRL